MQDTSRVGFLVIVFVALVLGAYAVLGKSVFAPKTTSYYADFTDAAGISPGAKVLMAGVKIGTVSEIQLQSPTVARMKLDIDSSHKIPTGSTAMLQTSLIGFGDNPVQILPPTRPSSGYLAANAVLKGVKGSALSGILPDSETTVAELNKTLAATRKLLEDQKLKKSLEDLLVSSNKTIQEFGKLANGASTLLAQNRSTLTKAMADAAGAIKDVRQGIELAMKLLKDDKLKGQIATILDKLNATGSQAELLVKNLNDFITDPSLRQPLSASMENIKTMTDSGTRIAASTEDIAKNGVTISAKAIELADKANLIADEARLTLQKLQGFFQKVPSGDAFSKVETRMDLVRESDPGRFRTDVDVTMPFKDFKLHLGVFDAFETNKMNAQIGQMFGKNNEYRYGVYAGKPGFGVQYQLAPKFYLDGNMFGLNDTRLDIRARYDFGKDIVGWLGINRVFDGNAPMIGIGIRK